MASIRGRGRRHTHRYKKRASDGFTPYIAIKTCAACGKQCYRSRDEARQSAKINHPGQVMHAYECEEPSGQRWWHLSSIPAGKLKRLRDREANGRRPGQERGNAA